MKMLNGILPRPSPGILWFTVYFPQIPIYLFIFFSWLLLHSPGRLLLKCCNGFQQENCIEQRHKLTSRRIKKPVSASAENHWQMWKERLWDLLYICVTAHGSSVSLCQPRVARRHKWPWTHLSALHPVRAYDAAHSLAATGSKDKR